MRRLNAPAAGDMAAASGATSAVTRGAIRVVLADDSVLFREGIARVLAENGFLVVGQAGDAEALHAVVERADPDVVVTDIRMPPTNSNEGLLAARRIRAEHPHVGVLVLSQYVEPRQAIKLLQDSPQRVGYLLKDRVSDIGDFADAIRRIARGGSAIDPDVVAQLLRRRGEDSTLEDLTGREQDILALMAEGRSNRAICERLFLSPKTVETHVGSIFAKLGLLPGPTTTGECSRCSCTSGMDEHLAVPGERLPATGRAGRCSAWLAAFSDHRRIASCHTGSPSGAGRSSRSAFSPIPSAFASSTR
jgi:DNA-binding NarL/FixJ family response regulator